MPKLYFLFKVDLRPKNSEFIFLFEGNFKTGQSLSRQQMDLQTAGGADVEMVTISVVSVVYNISPKSAGTQMVSHPSSTTLSTTTLSQNVKTFLSSAHMKPWGLYYKTSTAAIYRFYSEKYVWLHNSFYFQFQCY